MLVLLLHNVRVYGRAAVTDRRLPLQVHMVLVPIDHFEVLWFAGRVPRVLRRDRPIHDEMFRLALAIDSLHTELVVMALVELVHSEGGVGTFAALEKERESNFLLCI